MFVLFVVLTQEFRNLCQANINGNFYDISPLANNSAIQSKTGNYTYYFSLCRPLQQTDLGISFNIDTNGHSVARIHRNSFRVELLVPFESFEFDAERTSSGPEELVYHAFGQPILHPEHLTYSTTEVYFHYFCSSNSSLNPSYQVFYEIDESENRIELNTESKFGCSIQTATPSPTPYVSIPPTAYLYQLQGFNDTGIEIDLDDLNGPRNGIRVPLRVITPDNQNPNNRTHVLFYQPAERIECPIDSCNSPYSTAWLCTANFSSCESYGDIADEFDIAPLDKNDIQQGIIIQSHYEKKTLRHHVQCTSFGPYGQFIFHDTAYLIDNTLHIVSVSKDFCLTSIRPELIDEGNCAYLYVDSFHDYTINLSEINNPDPNGWSSNVTISGSLFTDYTWYFQPCGFIPCPSNSDCQGHANASLWLCSKNPSGIGQECNGFGFVNSHRSAQVYSLGALVKYRGDDNIVAMVNMQCNTSLDPGQITMSSIGFGSELDYRLSIATSNVCAKDVPTPSPFPTFFPTVPTPLPNPTLNPNPDTWIYQENSTHYVVFDLAREMNYKHVRNSTLVYNDQRIPFHYEFSSWSGIPPPLNYSNPSPVEFTNLWGCWNNGSSQNCYPLGSRNLSVHSHLNIEGSLTSGITVVYKNMYGVHSAFVIDCSRATVPGLFDLDARHVFYNENGTNISFIFFTLGEFACPRLFQVSTPIPIPPTQAPDPKYKPGWKASTSIDNGKIIDIDFKRLKSTTSNVRLMYPDRIEKAMIAFFPTEPDACPSGYSCKIASKANVWKCYEKFNQDQNVCFPVGDSSYGFTISFPNNSNISTNVPPIRATYSGGLYHSESVLEIICDESLSSDQINFLDTFEIPNFFENAVYLLVSVKSACPHSSDFIIDKKKVGGAYFLLLLSLILILYFVIGTLITYCKTGDVSIPNASFWKGFGDNVYNGFYFLITCGFRTSKASNYEQIT